MAAGEDSLVNASNASSNNNNNNNAKPRQEKQYDYLLKFLLVGDSDVGKQEILSGLEDGAFESPFCSGSGTTYFTYALVAFATFSW
jgi:hypothetical protein